MTTLHRFLLAVLLLFVATPDCRAGEKDPLTRIAFGSCAHQDDPQPIWDAVAAVKPQLFIMLGDSMYHDVIRKKEFKDETMGQKFAKARAVPGFAKLLTTCRLLGTWDDHDYGLNDAGGDYLYKKAAQQEFLDYLGIAVDSPRRKQEGIYHAEIVGPPERSVQIILLDTRYFRGPLKKRPNYNPKDGPYDPSPNKSSTMLGDAQWKWLAEQLKKPAQIRLLVSSIQVVAQEHHHEKWYNLPHEREQLYALLRETQAAGVIVLSGDRHLAELSMMDAGIGYPLYDLTASGLTQGFKAWRPHEPNRHRVVTMNHGNNFGVVTIDWDAKDPVIGLQVRDQAGETRGYEPVKLSTLQPGKWKPKVTSVVRLASGEELTEELIKKSLNKEVTIEMTVMARGATKSGDMIFLNSSERSSPDNFTVVLDKKAQDSLKLVGIASPRDYYESKVIRVTGRITYFRNQPQIIVSDAKQIVRVD